MANKKLKAEIESSKKIYELLKKFDSEQIKEILARVLNKVLRSAPNKEAQIDYLEQLADLIVEKLDGPNPFEKIIYQEKGSDVIEEIDFYDFELMFEEIKSKMEIEANNKQ